MAKHAAWSAKSGAEKKEFAEVSPGGDGTFCIAEQMDRKNQDVGENCIRNEAGELELTDKHNMKAWV